MTIKEKIMTSAFRSRSAQSREVELQRLLPGRTVQSVVDFLKETTTASLTSTEPTYTIRTGRKAKARTPNIIRELTGSRIETPINNIKAHKYYNRTSGDVNDIAFDADLIAVGCIATDDEYNRPGNLLLQQGNRMQSLTHQNDSTKHSSISSVKFVSKYIISGGTDGTLKIFSRKGNFLYDKSSKYRLSVNDIAVSKAFSKVAVTAHGSGHLDLHLFDSIQSSTLSYHDSLAPATLAFNDVHKQLLVGYECQDRRFCAGQASIFDIERRLEILQIKDEQSYAHCAVSADGYWLAGTNSPQSGTVSIYDPRSKHGCVIRMRTDQRDINEVSMIDRFITCAATDSTCHVWDIRSDKSLHILRHGKSKLVDGSDDVTGITNTAALASKFISGGSDGVVKLWDLSRNSRDVFLQDVHVVDSPITRMALSPSQDVLVVGENKGTIHMLSYLGDGTAEVILDQSLTI